MITFFKNYVASFMKVISMQIDTEMEAQRDLPQTSKAVYYYLKDLDLRRFREPLGSCI